MANGSNSGGLLGALSQLTSSGLLGDIGMGLLSASHYGVDPGQAMQQALAAGQQRRMNQYQMDFLQAQLPFLKSAARYLQGPQQPTTAPVQAPGPAPAALSNAAPIVGPFSPTTAAARALSPDGAQQASPPQPSPQGSQFGDPWSMYNAGVAMSASPYTAPMGKALIAKAQAILANDPRYVTQRALAASTLSQDQAAMSSASPGSLAYKGALQKFLTDSKLLNIGSYNAAVTTGMGLTPQQLGITSSLPTHGIQVSNGQESPIPGAVPTQQALAGAEARGQAQGEVTRVWNPQTQQWQFVPRSALLGGQGAGAGAGPSAPLAGPNPMLSAYLSGTGKVGSEQVGSLQTAANAAQRANLNLAQILAASDGVVTGPTAAARKWADTATAAITQWFGVAPPKALANYQELSKYGNQLAFAMTRQLGSREAGQIVQLEMQSNPNQSNVPMALRDLVGAAHAANDYAIAQNQYVQTVAARNGGNAEMGQANFTSNADPRVWLLGISSALAAKWGGRIGVPKIAATMPYMLPSTAYDAFRNLPRQSQIALTKRLDPSFMTEMVNAAGQ